MAKAAELSSIPLGTDIHRRIGQELIKALYLKAMAKEGRQDLQTLYRVFNLIKLLSAPPYYTAKKLADTLGVSKKTIYKYV